jgi:protein-ribulosamine 3-kinase
LGGPPAGVLRALEAQFGAVEVGATVGGGCVNPAARVRIAAGSAFLKFNADAPPGMFSVEAGALRDLRAATDLLRVPDVLAVGPSDFDPAADAPFILLEWLEPVPPAREFGLRLGRGLAALHRSTGSWGWREDGFIGPLPQQNRGAARWSEFWRDHRLLPQLELARQHGYTIGRESEWGALWSSLDGLLAAAELDGPSLLHGDLWSGNVLAVQGPNGGEPALVDPASYFGHREVDLAMAELFGGFPVDLLGAYEEAWPLQPGYRTGRRAVYQLYYLLVHVNLFGAGYVARTEAALREAVAAR